MNHQWMKSPSTAVCAPTLCRTFTFSKECHTASQHWLQFDSSCFIFRFDKAAKRFEREQRHGEMRVGEWSSPWEGLITGPNKWVLPLYETRRFSSSNSGLDAAGRTDWNNTKRLSGSPRLASPRGHQSVFHALLPSKGCRSCFLSVTMFSCVDVSTLRWSGPRRRRWCEGHGDANSPSLVPRRSAGMSR